MKKDQRLADKGDEDTRAALESPEIAKEGAKSGDFMKWGKPAQSTQPAGATLLRKMPNPQHSIYLLAEAINQQVFDSQFGPLYADGLGRPLFRPQQTAGSGMIEERRQVASLDLPPNNGMQWSAGSEVDRSTRSLCPIRIT
ncbi:MAG TPA: hypothetical protein VE262_24920 [Blastocatellia bacterium]|nr:hypothetical protein [Blastocatellia bacterium]